jgi:hypothetical protein
MAAGSFGDAAAYAAADTPTFFQSTKFFACLDVEEARSLFRSTHKARARCCRVCWLAGWLWLSCCSALPCAAAAALCFPLAAHCSPSARRRQNPAAP